MAKKPFLTVYGHVTVDQIVSVERFPSLNETVDAVSKMTALGGTGANIAIAASRLGVPTALCAFIGPDLPDKYLREMEKAGVIADEVVVADGFETSQCILFNDSGLKQKAVFYQGPQGFASKIGIDLLDNASRSEHVHFCTGEPDYYIRLMSNLRGRPAKIAFDPAQETYRLWSEDKLRKGVGLADCVFCNEYEAKVIEKRLGIASVLDLDKPLVVRTDGPSGSIARADGEIYRIPCIHSSKIVDATGCGDTYRAGFYAGLYHGYSVRNSLVLASAVASFTIEAVGALNNVPDWSSVEERASSYLE